MMNAYEKSEAADRQVGAGAKGQQATGNHGRKRKDAFR